MHFGHSIDGAGPLDTEVRSGVTRGGGPEGSDGTGDKETEAVLQGQIQHVVKTYLENMKMSCLDSSDIMYHTRAFGTLCVGAILEQTCDVDLASQGHISLPYGTEQSTVVDQPSDPVVHNQLPEVLVVQHISIHKWA